MNWYRTANNKPFPRYFTALEGNDWGDTAYIFYWSPTQPGYAVSHDGNNLGEIVDFGEAQQMVAKGKWQEISEELAFSLISFYLRFPRYFRPKYPTPDQPALLIAVNSNNTVVYHHGKKPIRSNVTNLFVCLEQVKTGQLVEINSAQAQQIVSGENIPPSEFVLSRYEAKMQKNAVGKKYPRYYLRVGEAFKNDIAYIKINHESHSDCGARWDNAEGICYGGTRVRLKISQNQADRYVQSGDWQEVTESEAACFLNDVKKSEFTFGTSQKQLLQHAENSAEQPNDYLPPNFNRNERGSCMYAAELITKKLLENGRHDFQVVEGWIAFGYEWDEAHTWIEFSDGKKLDPTLGQWEHPLEDVQYTRIKKRYTPEQYLQLCQKHPETNPENFYH